VFANGGAIVKHTRASNAEVNLKKEKQGLEWHDEFCKFIAQHGYVQLASTPEVRYHMLSKVVDVFGKVNQWTYFNRLSINMQNWIDMLKK
jgi:hypothetical protein